MNNNLNQTSFHLLSDVLQRQKKYAEENQQSIDLNTLFTETSSLEYRNNRTIEAQSKLNLIEDEAIKKNTQKLIDIALTHNQKNQNLSYRKTIDIAPDGTVFDYLEAGHPANPNKLVHLHGLVGSKHNAIGQLTDPEIAQLAHHIAPTLFIQHYVPEVHKPSFEGVTEYTNKLLTHRNIEKTSLQGVSLGGELAFRYALEHPEQVEKLILSGASGIYIEKLGGSALKLLISEQARDNAINEQFHKPEKINSELRQEIHDFVQIRSNVFWLSRFGKISNDENNISQNLERLETLKNYNIPVSLLRGLHDKITPISVTKKLQEILAIPDKSIHIFDTGHTPNIEQPEQYNTALKSILSHKK